MDRRARYIKVSALRVGADEPIEVARLEFVGVLGQGFQVADAIIARSGPELLAERQYGKGGVPACAGSADGPSLRIDQSRLVRDGARR